MWVSPVSEEELKRLYLEEEISLKDLGSLLGTTAMTIRKRLIRLGVDTSIRTAEPHHRHIARQSWKVNMSKEELKDYLQKEYVDNKHSMIWLKKELGVSHIIVKKYLIELGSK